MFAYDASGLTSLPDYTKALAFYERADRWRGEPVERVLDNSRKRYVTIRKVNGDSIACRLHHTDVVTYHPDNSLTIKPYGSRSTDEFASRLLSGTGISTYFNSGYMRVGDLFFLAVRELRLVRENDAWVVTNPEPFTWSVINRKVANALLKEYNYKAFAEWVRMLEATDTLRSIGAPSYYASRNMAWLEDRTRWIELLYADADAATTLKRIRDRLYTDNPQVYDRKEAMTLSTWQEIQVWKRN